MTKKNKVIPVFDEAIIETHCHLDYLDEDELPETLEKCKQYGVDKIITIAVSPDNLVKVRNLAEQNEVIWGTQGIHPHEAEKYTDAVGVEIEEGIKGDRILAVGEIGLDYFYDHADRQIQRTVFEKQLQIACDNNMPVVIHSREADDDMLAILQEYAPSLTRKGVIHSFTSGINLAEKCLEMGFYLGFNGIVTFNKADNVRDALEITPVEQVLLETDAPYLTPMPFRGRTNAPYYLPCIAQFVADQKQMPVNELIIKTRKNAEALFWGQ